MIPLPNSLQSDRLMTHMKVFCKEIGPRPSASAKERQAADYVRRVLDSLGIKGVQEQPFKSWTSLGWIALPALLMGVLAAPIGYVGGAWGKIIGGLLLLAMDAVMIGFALAVPPFFEPLIAWGKSQNVIARFAPSKEARRKIFLIGHLDTNKQRFMSPPPQPAILKPNAVFLYSTAIIGGVTLLIQGMMNWEIVWWQWLLTAIFAFSCLSMGYDETQPHIEGANDNATAATILLGMAEALKAQPLQNAEVTLLFTGCEEVPCAGIENYLRAFAPPKENTYWIDLEMVGTGNLCYITKHGVSYVTEYRPTPEMVKFAKAASLKNPDLKVIGKDMLILEELASVRRRGYHGICIAGYDKKGYLPNWHRVTDVLENIEPPTLQRAAHYTWALMQEIDQG